MQNEQKGKVKKVKKQNIKNYWPIKVLVLAIALSLCFSLTSEFLLGRAGIVVAVVIIVVFVSIAIITDMIGVAVTACTKEPFVAMASKKVRGAKEGLLLIKNADKVASLCADVIGDICGILSGAAGASIALKISLNFTSDSASILIASAVTALIAGITIFGKAILKRVAINHSTGITLFLARILNFFTKKG